MLSGALSYNHRTWATAALVLLAALFLLASGPASAEPSGGCGEGVSFELGADGTLTISGEGAMDDYDSYGELPSPFAGLPVERVVVEDGVSHIGSNAFRGCPVVSAYAPHVETIGANAFRDCSRLASLDAPEAVSIGTAAFSGCPLGAVVLPAAVEIGNSAFSGCSSLSRVEIPSAGSIGDFAFYRCASLALVDMPSVVSTGAGAFSECSSLAGVSMPSATAVGDWAFLGCSSLSSALVPSAVSIGFRAFEGAPLELLETSSSLESVGERAFYGLEFYDGDVLLEQTAESLRGCSFSGAGGKLLRIVPIGVGDSFSSGGLVYSVASMDPLEVSVTGYEGSPRSLAIPEAVAFEGLEFHVASIGKQAFYGCATLSSLDLGDVSEVGVKAFANCTKLKAVDAGDRLKTVSAYAFYRCVSLSGLSLEDSAKTLRAFGSYSFYKCAKISSVAVPSFMTMIGSHAFSLPFEDGRGNILDVSAESLRGYTYALSDGKLVRQPGIDVGIEFEYGGLRFVTTASLPAEVEVSGFDVVPRSLVVPSEVSYGDAAFAVTGIGENAFRGCSALRSVDLGEVETIGKQAFYGCSKLTSVSGDHVRSIGVKAFAYCAALSHIGFGDDLRTVSAYAFCKCRSLQSFDAPDSLRTIGSYAFFKCSSLSDVHSGQSLKTIGAHAFASCSGLGCIDFSDSLRKVGSGAFSGLTFQDPDGDAVPQTASALRGHSFLGADGVLVLSS